MTTSWVDAASERSGAISDALMAKARWLAQQCVVAGRIDMERLDEHQVVAYELAFAAAEREVLAAVLDGCVSGVIGEATAVIACDLYLRSILSRFEVLGTGPEGPGWPSDAKDLIEITARANSTEMTARCLDEIGERDGRGALGDDLRLLAAEFGRFADERIGPHAERIHREDTDVPESIIDGAEGNRGLRHVHPRTVRWDGG